MNQEEYIQLGLDGEAPLKIIMRGSIEEVETNKVGVVSIAFATMDKKLAAEKIKKWSSENSQSYYMVYSVPLDTDLTSLEHYPSIAVTKEDLA